MPSQTWNQSVGSSSGATLTLSYDSIGIAGSVATLVNPTITFYSKPGWTDISNYIKSKGTAIDDETLANDYTFDGGTDVFACTPTPITLVYGSTQTKTFQAEVYGISFFNGNSDTDTYSMSIVFPELPYTAPDAPSSVSLKRVSDTTQRFTFAGHQNTKTLDKYTQFVDWELQTDSDVAAWVAGASSLPGSTSSIDVTGTSVNHRYRIRVRFRNASGGASAWTTSDWIATTPAAPTVGAPIRPTTNQVTAQWSNTAPYRTGTKFGWKTDGGAETDPGVTATIAATSYTFTAAAASTHQYRVYHVIASVPLAAGGTTTLVSAASSWSTVVLPVADPLAPTVTVSAAVFDAATTDLVVTVGHNPVDATPQSDAEIQYRIGAGAWTPVDLNLATSHTFTAGTLANGNTYEIQGRTKGVDPDWSPWSTSLFVTTSGTPSVSIIAPANASTLPGSALDLELGWSDDDPAGPVAYDVVVKDATADVLWSGSSLPGSIDEAPYRIPLTLEDGAEYTLEARGRDGAGLWSSWVSSTFDVDYAPPPQATIVATEWLPTSGTVAIEIQNPAAGVGEVDGTSQELQWLDGSVWRTAAGDLPVLAPGSSLFVVHWTPPTHTTVTYRMITRSDVPSSIIGTEFTVATPADGWVYLNYGEGFMSVARLHGDVEVAFEGARDKERITPVGRTSPIELLGDASALVWKLSGRVAKRQMQEAILGTQQEWIDIVDAPAPICLRDYTGLRVFGSLDPGVSVNRKTGQVSASLTVIDYVE